MRAVTFQSLLDGAATRLGMTPGNLMADQAAALAEYIGSRVKDVWELYDWPFARVTEMRAYRPIYSELDSATIAEGDIVYHGTSYWQATQAAPTDAPAETSSQWAEPEPFARYVLADQPGKIQIGQLVEAYDADPAMSDSALPVAYGVEDDRFTFLQSSPNVVWLRFTKLAPTCTTSVWLSGTTYAAGALVYFGGDCFVAAQGSTGQEPPATGSNAYWTRQVFPDALANYAKLGAVADTLNEANQHDKARVMNALAETALMAELEKIFLKQQQAGTFSVATR